MRRPTIRIRVLGLLLIGVVLAIGVGMAAGDGPAWADPTPAPAFAERFKQGPVVMLTVMPSEMSMGRNLAMWFAYCVVVGAFAAYITGRALPPGAAYVQVFRFAGATAFIAYSAALWQMSIWYRRAWTTTIKATVDGLIFACLTAGAFGWLWPR